MSFTIFHKVFLSKTSIYGSLFSANLKTFAIESIFSPTRVLIQQMVNLLFRLDLDQQCSPNRSPKSTKIYLKEKRHTRWTEADH